MGNEKPPEASEPFAWSCPAPIRDRSTIQLGHGSGGTLTAELIRTLFLPAFDNPALARLDDQAVLPFNGQRLAFTTDSFVVKPLFFPGGDIGRLAVNGTVNDLAMAGAQPLALSAAVILEEGFPLRDLERVVESMRGAASEAGVPIVTGDTKVVERGGADGLFITTSGLGLVDPRADVSAGGARPGDRIVLSGSLGDHAVAVLSLRAGMEFDCPVASDTAPLHSLVRTLVDSGADVHCLRDPTRGGLSSTLNELAQQSQVSMWIEEGRLPVREGVKGVCEMLGFDPLYLANEGKLVAIVSADSAERAVTALRNHPLGREACIIGEVRGERRGRVLMRTCLGSTRIVDMLSGDQLPRIC